VKKLSSDRKIEQQITNGITTIIFNEIYNKFIVLDYALTTEQHSLDL